LSHIIILLTLADLSHFYRPFHVHLYWTFQLQNELQRDMSLIELAKDQIAFGKIYIEPLIIECNKRAIVQDSVLIQWDTNRNNWQLILDENVGA
jgi:hypothetical protein